MAGILDKKKSRVCQLIESPHQWALELFDKGTANNWTPREINMREDIKQWNDSRALNEDERKIVKRTLGLFSAGESMVANSVDEVEFKFITDGACRQYLLRKQYEEGLHNLTVDVCCNAFSLDKEEVAKAYLNIPVIKKKERLLNGSLDSFDDNFDINTTSGKQAFIKNFIIYYILCEGIWFFSNFALVLALGRQNKLTGFCDQIQYTLRDESLHLEFGINIINIIRQQYPKVWTKDFEEEIYLVLKEGIDLEFEYARDVIPNGILGVNYDSLVQYIKFLANDRISKINLLPIFEKVENPFVWLNEAQDAPSMAAFFERKERSYQQAGALEDDF